MIEKRNSYEMNQRKLEAEEAAAFAESIRSLPLSQRRAAMKKFQGEDTNKSPIKQ